jgi:glycosyltransferase involved in cell wall biosynthesis
MPKLKEGVLPGISLCMIVKNEEKYLAGCLESVKNLVDEMIIVDTGSIDKTVEIAESFGAHVKYFEWINDFAAARNISIEDAKHEWILYLDADERIEEKFHRGIKKITKRKDFGAFGLQLKCYTDPNDQKKYDIAVYRRLFRNYEGIKFEGRVHEQVSYSLEKMGAKSVQTDVVIEHLGYAVSEELMTEKKERNLILLNQHLKDNPADAYSWHQLGATYVAMGKLQEAYGPLLKALSIPKVSTSVKARVYNILATISMNYGEFYKCRFYARQSLKNAKKQYHAYYFMAESYFFQKQYDGALFEFLKLKNFLENKSFDNQKELTSDVSVELWKIYKRLAETYDALGETELAIQWNECAYATNNLLLDVVYNNSLLYTKLGKFEESRKIAEKLKKHPAFSRKYLLAMGNNEKSAKNYDNALIYLDKYLEKYEITSEYALALLGMCEIFYEQNNIEQLRQTILAYADTRKKIDKESELFRHVTLLKLYRKFKLDETFLHHSKSIISEWNADEIRQLRINFFIEKEKIPEAIAELDEAIRYSDKQYEFYKQKATLLEKNNFNSEAIQLFKKLESQNPGDSEIRFALGNLYQKTGQAEISRKYLS